MDEEKQQPRESESQDIRFSITPENDNEALVASFLRGYTSGILYTLKLILFFALAFFIARRLVHE